MPDRTPLRLRELLKRPKTFGVVEMAKRGQGSEIILLRPVEPDSVKGPQYPIKNHGPGTVIKVPVIQACLRRFDIEDEDFW